MTTAGTSVVTTADVPSTATVLPYADIELPDSFSAVTVDSTRPDQRSVFVPPVPHLLKLHRGLLGITLALTAFVTVLVPAVVWSHEPAAFGLVAEYAVFAAIAWTYCAHRLRRRLGFTVTPYEVRMIASGPVGTSRSRWPRATLLDVHANIANHQLVFRRDKLAAVNIFLSNDRPTARQVIDELDRALREIPPAPPGSQPQYRDSSDGLPPSNTRTILHRTGMALSVLALMALPFTNGLSCYGLIPGAVLIGIALGSQKKEFYT